MKLTKSQLKQIIAEELGEAQSVMGVPRNRADLPIEALELSEEIVTKFGIRREAAQKIVGWLVEEQLLKL
tara:strand:+ start:262 stop:471 length:210 start_codon:yes stop_codon:yes gene_type:complete